MTAAAEQCVRAWVNSPGTGLVGNPPAAPGLLPAGAYLAGTANRSPADGAYASLSRAPSTRDVVAEPSGVNVATVTALIVAGTVESAELAATAYADAVRTLTGNPVPMGAATCLAHDNLTGPSYVPQPADSGETFAFSVTADFLLAVP